MEDNLFSCSCPKCRNSLLEAVLCNPLFFFESQCPFCATSVHWSRSSVAMIIAGVSLLGTGGYYLGTISELPEELSALPAVFVALGAASFLFGLITFRMVAKKVPAKKLQMISNADRMQTDSYNQADPYNIEKLRIERY